MKSFDYQVIIKEIVFVLALLTPLPAYPIEWSGTVIGISDGDTLKVLTSDKRQVKIRLAEIDAPESHQAFGTQSKQSLSDICFKKSVVVDDKGTDRYKRTLGRIRCDGIDANAEQVKRGLAWAYRQYLTDPSIATLEEEAKTAKAGLWSEPNPTPPWEFRHGNKSSNAAKPTNAPKTSAAISFTCGSKSRCGEMSGCDEARFYLEQCGLIRLDSDHDGVPCEPICR